MPRFTIKRNGSKVTTRVHLSDAYRCAKNWSKCSSEVAVFAGKNELVAYAGGRIVRSHPAMLTTGSVEEVIAAIGAAR